MGSNYVIYSYFNSDQMQAVLNAVVMLVGSGSTNGDYLGLIRVAALLGLIMSVLYGFLRARGEDAAYYLIMVALFYSTLFIPRVTVTIEDKSGVGAAPAVVANVPLGLAFFTSMTTHIGYWLTERSETMFSLPDTSLNLSQHGLMSGSRALRYAQSAAITDPVVAMDMTNFMRDCINPELVTTPTLVQNLMESTDIWGFLGTSGIINPGRLVTLSGSYGAKNCQEAYTILNGQLTPSINSEFKRIAQMMSPQSSVANAQTMLQSLLPAAESLIISTSQTADKAIKQRMMINVMNDTSANMAQIMNDPVAGQTALGTAIASSNANSTYLIMAKVATEALPMIRNAVELVIIGIFPIVLVLIIIAGSKGGLVLRSYVMTMFWVALWAPLYAIVNYIGTIQGARNMKAALSSIDGASIQNAAQLASATISMEAVAGMLTIAVPMIALAIVKGGEVAMSGVTSSIMGPSQSAAGSAGSQVGSGNVSLGNTSWGNYNANNSSANKFDTSFGYKDPNRGDITGQYGSWTARGGANVPDGLKIGGMKPEFSNVGVGAEVGGRFEQGHGRTSGMTADFTKGTNADLTRSTNGSFAQQNGVNLNNATQKVVGDAIRASETFAKGSSFSNATNWGQNAKTGMHSKQETANVLNLGADAGVGLGGAFQAGGGAPPGGQMPVIPQGQMPQPGGGAAPGAPGALPAAAQSQIAQLAGHAANAVGNAAGMQAGPGGGKGLLKGKLGLGLDANLSHRSTDAQGSSAEMSSDSGRRSQVEANATHAAQAVKEAAARTENSSQRAFLESWVANFAKQVDSRFGTSVGKRLSESASETSSMSDSASGSVTQNRSEQAAQNALAFSGGNVDTAMRNLLSGGGYMGKVADATGNDIRQEVSGVGGTARGLGGIPINPPVSVGDVDAKGTAEVTKAHANNDAAAAGAGASMLGQGRQKAADNNVPMSGPNDKKVQDQYGATQNSANAGLAGGMKQEVAKYSGGQLMASIQNDRAGIGRLFASQMPSFMGFTRANTPEQDQAAFEKVVAQNPDFTPVLQRIHQTGKVTQDDREAFYKAVSQTK